MRRTALIVAVSLCAADLASAQAETPVSRAGTVLFKMPADRQRQEYPQFTLLQPVDPNAKTYVICIRPPAEAKASARESLAAHVAAMGQAFKVEPASEMAAQKHPAGYDAAVRAYAVTGADGRTVLSYMWLLQSGSRSVVIEFFADQADKLADGQAITAFITECRLAHAAILVAGDPPLTLYDLEETIDFLGWLLDAPFTADQRQVFRDEIVDGWKKKDAETIEGVAVLTKVRAELSTLTPDQQDLVRKQKEKDIVAAVRQETDRCSKLLIEIYDAAHKPIAEADPALTRQQADCALEVFYFMAGQLEGVRASPTAADKQEWAKRLSEGWTKLDANVRKSFQVMPLMWAAIRAGWAEMAEKDREEMKRQFAQLDVVKEMRTAFAKIRSDAGAATDAAALQAKIQSNYQVTSTLLKTGYDSTMMQMAAMRNMTDNRYRWSYRPK